MKLALSCYAWDFADEGADALLSRIAGAGFSHLFYAVTYHTGWFLHARRAHKTFMPLSGAHYFEPQREWYGKLQPLVAPPCEERDWTREVGSRLDEYGLKMIAWTVGAHNFRQGTLYPECASLNCFGDVYPHALCPAQDDVRQYLLALARDAGSNLNVESLALEAFDYQGWKHDHQHERDFYNFDALENALMNLCFHPATMNAAQRTGVDAESVRAQVAARLQSRFNSAPERPARYPASLEEARAQIEGLKGYEDAMNGVSSALQAEAARAMQPASWFNFAAPNEVCKPLCSAFSFFAYGEDGDFVRHNYPAAKAKAGEHELWVMVKMGAREMPTRAFVEDLVSAAREIGADGLNFYNYSEAPPRVFEWVCEAIER